MTSHFRAPRGAASLKRVRSFGVLDDDKSFPRSEGRGLIEAYPSVLTKSAASPFPRSEGRGLIEAGVNRDG